MFTRKTAQLVKQNSRHFSVSGNLHRRPREHEVYTFGNSMGFGASPRQTVFHPSMVTGYDGTLVTDLAVGFQHTLVQTETRVYGFGNNEHGQLGIPFYSGIEVRTPVWLQTLGSLVPKKVDSGRTHTLLLTAENHVFSFGSQEMGQLGNGVTDKGVNETPTRISSLKDEKIVDISCGLDHSVAVTSNGEIYSWGFNRDSQLGLGNTIDVDIPMKIQGIDKPIAKAFCGFDYTLAITSTHSDLLVRASPTEDGDFYSWGAGEAYQLGNGEKREQSTPILVSIPGEKINHFATGGTCVVALTGSVYSWGLGMTGRLGHGNEENYPFPTKIEFFERLPSPLVKVSGKGGHFLALSENGKLYSWGLGTGGRLGHMDEVRQCLPTQIEFFKNRKIICFAASLDHSVVVVEEE